PVRTGVQPVVGDLMTRDVVAVAPDDTLAQAYALMRARRIRHLPVVDRSGRLVGIVTDRDLRQVVFDPTVQARLARATDALRGLTVRDVMTWGAVSVTPATSVRDAARLLHERKIGALPVVEADRVVGILTERDVLATFREMLDEGVVARPYRWALAYR
ncbi:MAG TPA: CBS domain-containing protein, partial [Candidatus Acidoferrum sp.]|nr:CBS domain-containing protein [Candidatus Acidoferrum sp.]